jgi:hypothetical protein
VLRVALFAALSLFGKIQLVELHCCVGRERRVREYQFLQAAGDALEVQDEAVAGVVVRPAASACAASRVELSQARWPVSDRLMSSESADVAEGGSTIVADERLRHLYCRRRRRFDERERASPRCASQAVDVLFGRNVPCFGDEAAGLVRVTPYPADPVQCAPLASVRVWRRALLRVHGEWVDRVVSEPA